MMLKAPAALADALHHARFLEIGDDLLHGALRDADRECDVPESRFRVARKADQDVAVIRQECPVSCARIRLRTTASRHFRPLVMASGPRVEAFRSRDLHCENP